jgi:hypothetical protein
LTTGITTDTTGVGDGDALGGTASGDVDAFGGAADGDAERDFDEKTGAEAEVFRWAPLRTVLRNGFLLLPVRDFNIIHLRFRLKRECKRNVIDEKASLREASDLSPSDARAAGIGIRGKLSYESFYENPHSTEGHLPIVREKGLCAPPGHRDSPGARRGIA